LRGEPPEIAYCRLLLAPRKSGTRESTNQLTDRPRNSHSWVPQTKNKNQSVHCSNCPLFFPILRAGFDGTGA
jgi:hypothetical protein